MIARAETTMEQCICGHSQGEHIRTGGCRVPGCLCDRFRPIPEIDWMQPRVTRAHGGGRLRAFTAMAATGAVGAT
jgi:hypothetical protein